MRWLLNQIRIAHVMANYIDGDPRCHNFQVKLSKMMIERLSQMTSTSSWVIWDDYWTPFPNDLNLSTDGLRPCLASSTCLIHRHWNNIFGGCQVTNGLWNGPKSSSQPEPSTYDVSNSLFKWSLVGIDCWCKIVFKWAKVWSCSNIQPKLAIFAKWY